MKTAAACFLTLVFLLTGIDSMYAQTPTKSTTDPKSEKAQQVEVHEGMWGIVSYFGGKLVDELSTRLNLTEEDSTQTEVPTQVLVKVGNFAFTRTEMRAVEPKE